MATLKLPTRRHLARIETGLPDAKTCWALDAVGRLAKMNGPRSSDRFQAHCKWEMSG